MGGGGGLGGSGTGGAGGKGRGARWGWGIGWWWREGRTGKKGLNKGVKMCRRREKRSAD